MCYFCDISMAAGPAWINTMLHRLTNNSGPMYFLETCEVNQTNYLLMPDF